MQSSRQIDHWTPPLGLPLLPRFSDYLPYHAKQTPDADALVFGPVRINYGELQARVDACAKALVAAGVAKGDRVATLSPPHPDYFVVFLACAGLGAIWMGLNPKYQIDESRYLIDDAAPVLLFARTQVDGRDYAADLQRLHSEFPCIQQVVVLNKDPSFKGAVAYADFIQTGENIKNSDLAERRAAVTAADPALLVYTSGTTGKPKGALLPHRGLVKCSLVQRQYIDIRPLSAVNFFPINHVGCVSDISGFLYVAGGCCHFLEKFDVERSLQVIASEKISLWIGGPTTFQMSLNAEHFVDYDLSAVQMIVWGGGAASMPLIEQLEQQCPRLLNLYGQTETVGSITFTRPGCSLEELHNTVGAPADCYEVLIVDAQGVPLGVGQEGEIVVRGDFTMRGYLNRPEATAETIDSQGFLHTGDLGVWREDGNIQLVGRIKEMFKSGGYNVYPLEVEQVLQSYPLIDDAVVVAVPHELYGEVGYAYLQMSEAQQQSYDETALKAFCRAHLANYKIPKQFEKRLALPLLPIGKIDRTQLKQAARRKHRDQQPSLNITSNP